MASLFGNNQFDIILDGVLAKVTEHTIQERQVFRLKFDDHRAPLTISVASTWSGNIWTSIPQGRQQEAERWGKKIAEHLKDKK